MTDSTTPNPASEPNDAPQAEAPQAEAPQAEAVSADASPDSVAPEPAVEALPAPEPEMVESAAPELEPVVAAAEPEPVAAGVVEAAPVVAVVIPVAEPAPLAAPEPAKAEAAPAVASTEVLGLPLKLLNQLLAKLGTTQLNSLADLVPVLRILALAVVAGIALKLTSATIGAIDDLPLVGGLLELVGLVSLLNFLARNAFKQQKRAELLARIQKLKTDLLG